MKKIFAVLAIVALVLIVVTATVLAYSSATGCVVDNTGAPWTYGGDVTVEYPANSGNFISYTTTLDANGCFNAQLWPSGVHVAGTLHIDPAAGPQGDPAEILCEIPADDTQTNFDCGTMSTNTGPNAVVWSGMQATTSSPLPFALAGLGIAGLLIGATVWRRSRIKI